MVAPDLRGHGDSEWVSDGDYDLEAYVYDIAELIFQRRLAPLTIVAHSLGGKIATCYAGLYPHHVCKLVLVEGMGATPASVSRWEGTPPDQRLRTWIDETRAASQRGRRGYAAKEEAVARMSAANPHLATADARRIAEHGIRQREDGLWDWKFDPRMYVRSPRSILPEEMYRLWQNIACPVLVVAGADSNESNPSRDGRLERLKRPTFHEIKGAGHWPHHDQPETFLEILEDFLDRQ